MMSNKKVIYFMKMEFYIINNNSYVIWKICFVKFVRIFVIKFIREILFGEDFFVRFI